MMTREHAWTVAYYGTFIVTLAWLSSRSMGIVPTAGLAVAAALVVPLARGFVRGMNERRDPHGS